MPVAEESKHSRARQDATIAQGDQQSAELAILKDPLVADELEISEQQLRLLGEIQQRTPLSELPGAVLEALTPTQRERWKKRVQK